MAQRGLSLLARSIDSIVYWRDPMASAGLLAAGLGFYFLPLDHDFLLSYCGPKASRFVEPLTLRYSSTATAIMLCLVHLLVSVSACAALPSAVLFRCASSVRA
jgi:hypothetical protein